MQKEGGSWSPESMGQPPFGGVKFRKVKQSLLTSVFSPGTVHFIFCDSGPVTPFGFTVKKNRRLHASRWRWNPSIVKLHVPDSQTDPRGVEGRKLLEELEKTCELLPAVYADYLYDHPDLIPEGWEAKVVFFWGTIFDHHGEDHVRFLFSEGGRVNIGMRGIDSLWFSNSPAAIIHA